MKQDERAPFVAALERARVSAYPPGEYVEQESFMVASEILALARQAAIFGGVSVLDLCCGIAGPGRFITRELGCSYLGVDLSASAIEIARERARDLPCRFEVGRVPPVPQGQFDVVLLLETLLAFPDKQPLLDQVSESLTTGGRFAFTIEEGLPLTESERERMPDADTVWLMPLDELLDGLGQVGLLVRWKGDHSASHRAMAGALSDAFAADAAAIAAQIGRQAFEELLAAHRLWSDWLEEGRVRKLAFVAEKTVPALSPRRPCRLTRRKSRGSTSGGASPAVVRKTAHPLDELTGFGHVTEPHLVQQGRDAIVRVLVDRRAVAGEAGQPMPLSAVPSSFIVGFSIDTRMMAEPGPARP